MKYADFSTARWVAPGGAAGRNVEVAFVDGMVGLRDSATPDGPVLVFDDGEWRAFLAGIELGEFDASEILTRDPAHSTGPGGQAETGSVSS